MTGEPHTYTDSDRAPLGIQSQKCKGPYVKCSYHIYTHTSACAHTPTITTTTIINKKRRRNLVEVVDVFMA